LIIGYVAGEIVRIRVGGDIEAIRQLSSTEQKPTDEGPR
jgi:hypothetical protein